MEKTKEPALFVDIALSRPMIIDGTEVASVRMREPTVADQLAGDETPGSNAIKEVATFANLCMLSPDDIKRMPMRDYAKLQKAYVGFLS